MDTTRLVNWALVAFCLTGFIATVEAQILTKLPWAIKHHNYKFEFQAEYKHRNVTDKYIKWIYGRLQSFENSTVRRDHLFSGNFTVRKELPANAWFTATAYDLLNNNKYSEIPKEIIRGPLCDLIKYDLVFYYDLKKHSNLPTSCPIAKGYYHIDYYEINMDYMPPKFTKYHQKLDLMIRDNGPNGEVIFYITFLVNVYNR